MVRIGWNFVDAPALTRTAIKQRQTRIRLRQVAYDLMATQGVDATSIQQITDGTDIGFGTFYNYYASKEALALDVLDCAIHNIGERNDLVTRRLDETDPARIVANSVRFVIREMTTNSMWRFWLDRLDLLIDRAIVGFGPYGLRDIGRAVAAGRYHLVNDDPTLAWHHLVWMMTAAARDVLDGRAGPTAERDYVVGLMRINGLAHADADAVTSTELPESPALPIDFAFDIPS